MESRQMVFALVSFFHNLFTVIWVGGLLMLGGIVLPVLLRTRGRGRESKEVMDAIQSRLSGWIYVSIVGLTITGILLGRRNPAYAGLFGFDNTYSIVMSIKHILILIMVGIALLRSLLLDSVRFIKVGTRLETKRALLYVNLALGILVLLLSSVSAALGTKPPPFA